MRFTGTEIYDDCVLLNFEYNNEKKIMGKLWKDKKEINIAYSKEGKIVTFRIPKEDSVQILYFRIFDENKLIYRRRLVIGKYKRHSESIWFKEVPLSLQISNVGLNEYSKKFIK